MRLRPARSARTPVLAAAAAAGLLTTLVVLVAPPAHAATASFRTVSEWSTGYEGRFTITNDTEATMTGWTVRFTLPAGTAVGTFWDTLLASSGQQVTARHREYNGTVPPGASVSFGFIASGTGTPTDCTINGAPCGPGDPPGSPPPGTEPPPTTPPPSSPPPSSPPPPPPPGTIRSAPYLDITMPSPSLTEVAQATGQRHFTLAFVLGSAAGCVPRWGGTIPLDEPRIVADIAGLRALGGDVVVAFGGAVGPYLEHVCGSVSTLADAYLEVVDTLNIRHLDVDVEATVPTTMMNQALARVQQQRPGVTVSYTLMVQGDDFGLTPALGVDVLTNAKANGVDVHLVNPMTMEFGSSRPNWGDAVIAAAEATLGQMAEIWPDKSAAERRRMLGVTPMIGRNFNGRIFTQAHARQLVAWADDRQIGLLAFWSVGRDNGSCPGGGVSPTCSSIPQSQYEFTGIFGTFTG